MATAETQILQLGTDFDAVAVLNLPKGSMNIPEAHGFYPDPRLTNAWGRDRLISFVADEGVEPLVTRGKAYYDLAHSCMRLLRPHVDVPGMPAHVESLGWYSTDSVGVVHNIAKPLPLAGLVPQLNAELVRGLAVDKYETAELLRSAGLHGGSIAVQEGVRFDPDALDEIKGTLVFVKPRFGSRSEGVLGRMPKSEVASALQNHNKGDYVVEGLVDYSHRWPSSIKAIDEENKQILDNANRDGANKELRAYSFGNGEFYFVGRAAHSGETDFATDDWVFLDQDTIPPAAMAVAQEVYHRFCIKTGVKEMHLGIDMPYASTAETGGEPRWLVGEVNAGEPQLAKYSENADAANAQRKHLAAQIARIARKRSLA